MKITKRILGTLTSVVCAFSVCASALSINASAEGAGTVGDLTYYAYDNYVIITDCVETASTVIIPDKILDIPVTAISDGAFENCAALTQVTIPDTITSIGAAAFSGCSALKAVTIPESVTTVGSAAFYNTGIVNEQTGPVYYVSSWAVDSDAASAVEIKSGTKGIADATFYGGNLETVSIPETVKTIGELAFSDNDNIREVKIPEGVVTLGAGAFYHCDSLLKITMPSTLKTIGESAYAYCESLANIKIPSSVNSIGSDAFEYTADYKSQLGPVIYIDTWVVNCLDSTEQLAVEVKSGTKGIADSTFAGKTFVISASIPAGVKTVGNNAFNSCTSLSQLSLPETLVTIGAYAFSDTRIPSIEVPASVTSIGDSAFYNCTNLSDITIKNAGCEIYDSPFTIYAGAKMHVADKSTAYNYAIKYDRSFDYVAASAALLGDVTGDGELNLYDVIEICKSLMGMVTLTNEQQKVADTTGDGQVNIYDAIAVAMEIM